MLDEATSHLDIQREMQVNAAVTQLAMTRLIVAHRPETIASAQRVIMLQGGKVVLDQSTAAMRAAVAAKSHAGVPAASRPAPHDAGPVEPVAGR